MKCSAKHVRKLLPNLILLQVAHKLLHTDIKLLTSSVADALGVCKDIQLQVILSHSIPKATQKH